MNELKKASNPPSEEKYVLWPEDRCSTRPLKTRWRSRAPRCTTNAPWAESVDSWPFGWSTATGAPTVAVRLSLTRQRLPGGSPRSLGRTWGLLRGKTGWERDAPGREPTADRLSIRGLAGRLIGETSR